MSFLLYFHYSSFLTIHRLLVIISINVNGRESSEFVHLVGFVAVGVLLLVLVVILVAGNKVFVVLLLPLSLPRPAIGRITRRHPSVQRACPPSGACSQSVACRSWDRASGICRRSRRWSAQPEPPSSGPWHCGLAAS